VRKESERGGGVVVQKGQTVNPLEEAKKRKEVAMDARWGGQEGRR